MNQQFVSPSSIHQYLCDLAFLLCPSIDRLWLMLKFCWCSLRWESALLQITSLFDDISLSRWGLIRLVWWLMLTCELRLSDSILMIAMLLFAATLEVLDLELILITLQLGHHANLAVYGHGIYGCKSNCRKLKWVNSLHVRLFSQMK